MTLKAPPSLDLPVAAMTVPVMIALLTRIIDQLHADPATSDVADDLTSVVAKLILLREQAAMAMAEVDAARHACAGPYNATPAKFC